MRIKKLTLKNIRSYEELEIEFPRGSVLLSGEIGSGKTSILLGLQFALFGLQPGQKGLSILRRGCDSAYVCVEIEIDGQTVSLERTIKKSRSGGITQDSNIITVGEEREELSTLEMKNRVITLLNYPSEFAKKSNLLYKYTVYTPQEEMKGIIEERPEVRLDTIRHIFGVDRYKKIKENASIFLQKLKETIKIKEVLVSELGLLREKLKIEQEKKTQLARVVNNLRVENNMLAKEKEVHEKIVLDNGEEMNVKKNLQHEIVSLEISLREKKVLEERLKKEMSIMQREVAVEVDFSQERLTESEVLLTKHKALLDERNTEYLEINSQILAIETRKEVPQEIAQRKNDKKNKF